MTKARQEQEQEGQPLWDLPFTESQLLAWKAEFGEYNIHLVEFGKEQYVIRGLGRAEFQTIAKQEYKNEEEMENEFVISSILFPSMSVTELRNKKGGLIPTLFEKIMQVSNVDPNREINPVEFTIGDDTLIPEAKELLASADIQSKDLSQWFGMHKNLYYEVLEHQLVIYHGLRRSDFEKHNEGKRKGEHFGPSSEEHLVSKAVIYPYNINPLSNDFLHGSISKLANLVYAASGYNAVAVVRTL